MGPKTVLVVDDEKLVRWSIRQKLEAAGFEVVEAESASEALQLFQEYLPDLVTLDVRLPDDNGLKVLLEMKRLAPSTAVIMITAYGAVDDAVKALQIGAYDFLEKPINFERLLHSIQNALETTTLRNEVERNKEEQRQTYSLDRIIGESEPMKRVKALVAKVAASEANTLLVQGESGTGKDLVAKALHFESRRHRRPFTVLNCAAIPEQLLENELFGHERGAFTDAKTMKKGLLEMTDGGTIFFDEISEMPLNLQAKLLRVLEDYTFRRVGGVKDIRVDLRVVCASNKDLNALVREEKFREDLFYRLSVIPILLPPLRDRKEDLDLLARHFVDFYNENFKKSVKGLTSKARKLLIEYDWPGNVRELKNAIERAMILQDGDHIDVDLIPLNISNGSKKATISPEGLNFNIPSSGINLYDVEKELIAKALEKVHGNQSQASRLLSITRDTLRYKMKKYGLHKN
ncbi:MAG TPA: sigma-54 dependent transcriptional regulator [Acidobacteriota bacterium]|nr:sigma-54 dependent transcriptional regulator [Acidobacteriota bacterium]